MILRRATLLSCLTLALGLTACGGGDDLSDPVGDIDNDGALSDLAPLYEGWPGNEKLPDEGKADAVYPKQFDGPMQFQSPIRNQAARGVCSIFSAVGLMEHLYIKEGTITSPDFSEEFLQWSVKVELGRFTNTSGSNSNYNLQAINQYGIVEEALWPYLGRRWTTSDDAACTGEDDQPTRCYTHGDPPAAALEAQRFHLPRGRWISSRPNSIKGHMQQTGEAVVVGGTFFYQSWNHRGSTLPVNAEYFRKGYVTAPNDADIQQAKDKPAGHSFVLVGWDDDLEVQKRDGEGQLLTDENGNAVTEKGFWLFRNSWGTSSFGVDNPYGAGYGWISMDYVEDHLTAYVSGLPEVSVAEVCGDEKDNDFDGDVDCDDSDCASDPVCAPGATQIHENDQAAPIPDNDPNGVTSDIVVTDGGTIESLKVTVDITHSYKGDLEVKLVREGGGEVVLHDQTGGSEDDLKATFAVADFNGEDAAGTWRLVVIDHAKLDTGTLNGWTLEIKTGGASNTTVYESDEDVTIPDNDPMGAFSNIDVPDAGAITALKVVATIDHPYKGDLTVKLQRLGVPGEVVLQQADASSGNFGTQSFVVSDFEGQDPMGTWRLVVIDEAASDEGVLTHWSLEVTQ
ncbi:MAG: proprotein convertase P-domain-containing protein [Polyangiaceae bacterium]